MATITTEQRKRYAKRRVANIHLQKCACTRPAVMLKFNQPVCAFCLSLEAAEWVHSPTCGVANPLDRTEGETAEVFEIHAAYE